MKNSLPGLSRSRPAKKRDRSGSIGGSISAESSRSVGEKNRPVNASGLRRMEPLHRARSIHGSVTICATSNIDSRQEQFSAASNGCFSDSEQRVHLPFFATVCRSLFTAALIDPDSGLATSKHQSSGQLNLDFGRDTLVGSEYHRDILLVNHSEIELVWNTAVVSSKYKDAVWFSLRDLDSENVFGVDIVTCRAVGSGQAEPIDSSLKILGGTIVDFGQICGGVWAKKLVTCKNTGDKVLDVHLSATQTPGEVVFQLAGVAEDDMDEEVVVVRERGMGRTNTPTISHLSSRTSTREAQTRPRSGSQPPSRCTSPASSVGRSSSYGEDSPSYTSSLTNEFSRHFGSLTTDNRYDRSLGVPTSISEKASSSGREQSLPPSRPLSSIGSQSSSQRNYHSSADSEEEDDPDHPFFPRHGSLSSLKPLQAEYAPHIVDTMLDRNIPNQIEDITMRPGTEYRILIFYRPARDVIHDQTLAGTMRDSSFKVCLDFHPSSQRTEYQKARHLISCVAESCTSFIAISSGKLIDFGDVTIGAVKSAVISISNLSALSAKVEIAAVSKVLSTTRNVIIIPPHETVEERLEFFPRRINDHYEKQLFVRNILNRSNDQIVEIRSKNIDGKGDLLLAIL